MILIWLVVLQFWVIHFSHRINLCWLFLFCHGFYLDPWYFFFIYVLKYNEIGLTFRWQWSCFATSIWATFRSRSQIGRGRTRGAGAWTGGPAQPRVIRPRAGSARPPPHRRHPRHSPHRSWNKKQRITMKSMIILGGIDS